jgi:hypothetical protein
VGVGEEQLEAASFKLQEWLDAQTCSLQLAARSSFDEGKRMLIIPAIDLKDGACVRLRQGRMEDSTVFSDDPVSMAAKWVEGGCRRLHLVDLNGAFEGQPVNG